MSVRGHWFGLCSYQPSPSQGGVQGTTAARVPQATCHKFCCLTVHLCM